MKAEHSGSVSLTNWKGRQNDFFFFSDDHPAKVCQYYWNIVPQFIFFNLKIFLGVAQRLYNRRRQRSGPRANPRRREGTHLARGPDFVDPL